MHNSMFEYLKPTDEQLTRMNVMQDDFRDFAFLVDGMLPDGPDKDHVIRLIRDAAMWANVAITRHADGSPRS